MIESQIAMLTELAARDGHIDDKETALILRIGRAHGLSDEQIEALIKNPVVIEWEKLTIDDRFEMMHNVVSLMKADGEIFDEEISYCMDVTKRLGFPLEAVMELYPIIHNNVRLPNEVSRLKRKYQDYLNKKGS